MPASFFSDDEDEPGWKVVLRTEVRGRRIDSEMEDEEEPKIFSMGKDVDFEGLQVPAEVPETYPNPVTGGRNIDVGEVINTFTEGMPVTFDKDVGESSEDED